MTACDDAVLNLFQKLSRSALKKCDEFGGKSLEALHGLPPEKTTRCVFRSIFVLKASVDR